MLESCPIETARISNSRLVYLSGQADTTNVSRYMRQLCDSVLVPCPGGQNPETFRHYEVLATQYFYY